MTDSLQVHKPKSIRLFIDVPVARGVRNPMKISDIGFLKTEPN